MQKVDDVERKPNEEKSVVETKSASGEGKVISFALIKSWAQVGIFLTLKFIKAAKFKVSFRPQQLVKPVMNVGLMSELVHRGS